MDKLKIYESEIEATLAEIKTAKDKAKKLLEKLVKKSKLPVSDFAEAIGLESRQGIYQTLKTGSSATLGKYLKRILKILK